MWDGSVKLAKDVVVGDMLIGDDGKATRVRKTISGSTSMYDIQPLKQNFLRHRVTSNHILTVRLLSHKSIVKASTAEYIVYWWNPSTLTRSEKVFKTIQEANTFSESVPLLDAIVDITIDDYQKLSDDIKKQMVLFKSEAIHWPTEPVDVDPYSFGQLLLEGCQDSLTTDDNRIPQLYATNDVETRSNLVAGVLDKIGSLEMTDEGQYNLVMSACKRGVIEDLWFVIQSLGLSCQLFVTKTGMYALRSALESKWFEKVPGSKFLMKNKSFDKKRMGDDDSVSLFEISCCGVGPFVGWQLEGNGRFVGGDFTMYHNTPEGHSSGIVKNFTLFTKVSTRIESSHVQNLLENFFTESMHKQYHVNDTFILLNGRIIGYVKDPTEFVEQFRTLRRSKIFQASITIMHEESLRTIFIYSDDGRILRPLWNLREHSWKSICEEIRECGYDWLSLVEKDVIVYVDSYEVENAWVAMRPSDITEKHDYMEIHATFMFGVCVNLIPFVDHIQAPRITYQSSMCKQAIGMYSTTNDIRCDTVVHCLQYPEKPIVQTHLSELMHYEDLPSGNNLIVAIACYGGYNQEDSIIFNKSSIDRGVFRCFTYRTITTEEKKRNNNSHEIIELPESTIRNSLYNYDKLDGRGVITVGTYVGPNDVIVAKTVSTQKKGMSQKSDSSIVIRNGEEGYVDKIFESTTPDGYLMVKVKIRYLRIPEIGDKAASRSAQKGTIGMVFNHEDMPFTSDGIVPDIIINPQCIPSRMTINQLLECVAAKGACINGHFVYSTPFSKYSHNIVDELTQKLHETGFQRYGNEMMVNGFSGEPMKTEIFIGPTYYQRLKHLVASKIHARDHGSVQSLVRQPLEGRSKEGGLRFGEMERDCMISHGVSRFLNERLFDLSDQFQIIVCSNCGTIPNDTKRCYECEQDHIHYVNLPYACKLLFQELMAIGIKIHFRLKT